MPLALSALMLVAFDPTVLTADLSVVEQPHASTSQEIWMDALAKCESNGRSDIRVLDTDGYYSYGLYQFHLATWLKFGKEFGTTKANIYQGDLQVKVVKSMLDKGLWSHWWNCSHILFKTLGTYPIEVPKGLST